MKKDQVAANRAKKTEEGARSSATKFYRIIASEYKSYPQLDEVLALLAIRHEEAGDLQGARRAYLQLIQDTPQSACVPFAYLSLGEVPFAESQADPTQLEMARLAYDRAHLRASR